MKYLMMLAASALLITVTGCGAKSPTKDTMRIHFISGGNELNTFDHTITKDLVMDGKKTAEFSISGKGLARVKEKVMEIGFFGVKGPYASGAPPLGFKRSLRVDLDSQSNYLEWNLIGTSALEDSLNALGNLLDKIMVDSPEWKALPPARGGRL